MKLMTQGFGTGAGERRSLVVQGLLPALPVRTGDTLDQTTERAYADRVLRHGGKE